MELKQQLQNDLKDAMRAGDNLRKRTLRMVLSAIRLAEVDKRRDLDDNEILAVIQKEVKSRKESIEEARKAGRPELAEATEAEIGVLQVYLPQPLSEEELEALAKEAVNEAGATNIREMGQVMKILIPRLEGRATGQQASQAVRKLLS